MALTTCRECDGQVAKTAKTCPHCGTERPGQRGVHVSAGMGCLIILVAFGAMTMIIGGDSDTYTPSQPPAPTYVDINAAVERSSTQILVTNRDSFAWTNCTVSINPGLMSGGWEQQIARIGPGEQVAGGLLAFTRGNGERFQPSQYVVERVTVSCDTPNGDGFYSGAFR
jgi:hypothetical protein